MEAQGRDKRKTKSLMNVYDGTVDSLTTSGYSTPSVDSPWVISYEKYNSVDPKLELMGYGSVMGGYACQLWVTRDTYLSRSCIRLTSLTAQATRLVHR